MSTVKTNHDLIEAIVDSVGLRVTVDLLADICGSKAAHIAENWQDTYAAKDWEKAAGHLAQVAVRLKALGL